LEYDVQEDEIERRLEFWRWLNDGAVDARGEGARSEFKGVSQDDQTTRQVVVSETDDGSAA
jgi:hypothetical protein